MRRVTFIPFILIFSIWLIGPAWAQDPIVYPAQGQSEDQMEKDKYQCYSWAKNQTGFDPMKTPTTSTAPPAKEKEVWGSGKTAVAGGATGAIVGGAAKGKKGLVRGGLIGAAGGALIGGARSSNQRKREQKKREDWERREANKYVRDRGEYNRAFGACMEGRGYSVK
jgi:hypothetical protein